MSFREITGSIASITGDPTPGARFLVIPNDFVFSSGADTMVLADAKTVIADGSGNVSFTLHEGTYQIVYQTSRGAQSRGLTVDSEGPWTLGRLVGMPSQFTPALATQIFAAAAAAEAARDEAQAISGIEDAITSGSNSNGKFVRYADGTQICTGTVSTSTSENTQWTYPAEFSEGPVVFANVNTGVGGAARFANTAGVATTAAQINAWDTSGSRVAFGTQLTAIGRWF